MPLSSLLLFAAAYAAVVMLPGPSVTALVARVLARGTHGAGAYVSGTIAGALAWFAVAVTGLAAIAAAYAPLFVAIRYAGAAYLLYLAWKLWRAAPRPAGAPVAAGPDDPWRLFLAGLAVNLGNPKAVVFFLALLPTVVDVAALTPLGVAELAGVIAAIIACVYAAYVLAAGRARRLMTSPRAVRLVNRGSAVAMAGAAATIAAR